MKREIVLCFESSAIRSVIPSSGFHEHTSLDCLKSLPPWFAPRESVEEWSAFRQLIPYVVLVKGSEVCVYRRTRASGENRLHDRWSMGFGGHIHLGDVVIEAGAIDVAATARRAADREVLEEFGEVSVRERQFLGMIIDDANDVGKVHMGLVEVWHIDGVLRRGSENKQEGVQFVSRERLCQMRDEFESWSQLCVAAVAQERL